MSCEKGKLPNNFLAIDKNYFGMGLKPIDLIILSQIEEFSRNYRTCYMTDDQFSHITGSKKSAVRSSLQRMEDREIIIRSTRVIEGNGRANRRRYLRVNEDWREAISEIAYCYDDKLSDGMLINSRCYVENQQIKDNRKYNIIDNKKIIMEETSSSISTNQPGPRYY